MKKDIISSALGIVVLVLITWFNPLRMLAKLPNASGGRLAISGTKIMMDAPRLTGNYLSLDPDYLARLLPRVANEIELASLQRLRRYRNRQVPRVSGPVILGQWHGEDHHRSLRVLNDQVATAASLVAGQRVDIGEDGDGGSWLCLAAPQPGKSQGSHSEGRQRPDRASDAH